MGWIDCSDEEQQPAFDESIDVEAEALFEAWLQLRWRRDIHLKKVDIYQGVLLYNSLTEEQQTELADYRQALLDLPNSHDTPEDCYTAFPQQPDWMD